MKTMSNVRVHVQHPQRPAPSYAEVVATADWLKPDAPLLVSRVTEDQLYELAEEALKVAGILRRDRLHS